MITHPGMYSYIPTEISFFKRQTKIPQAGVMLFNNTRELFDDLLYWHFLCGLEADCIAPPGSLALPHLPAGGFQMGRWAGIHRFDQSDLNILIFNYRLNRNITINFSENILNVKRGDGTSYNMSTCKH